MKITVHGAGGGEVTGSAYLVETDRAKVLVDCGLFQGENKIENYNRIPKKGAFQKLDAVVLTHAHLDHTGRLPLLTRAGPHGQAASHLKQPTAHRLTLADRPRLAHEHEEEAVDCQKLSLCVRSPVCECTGTDCVSAEDGLTLYVSRGIGMEGKGAPRVRFLTPPEIILWELCG